MADFPIYTAQDLALFSGREIDTYDVNYSNTACDQATLMFKMATCLLAFPDTADEAQLASYAILSMADYLCLVQPYQQEEVGPFQSERIGSYSYSRRLRSGGLSNRSASSTMVVKIQDGVDTGVLWFDIAVMKLGVCDDADGIPMGGGVEVFEHDGVHTKRDHTHPNNDRFLGPKELNREPLEWGIPDPGYHLNRPGVPEYDPIEEIVEEDE